MEIPDFNVEPPNRGDAGVVQDSEDEDVQMRDINDLTKADPIVQNGHGEDKCAKLRLSQVLRSSQSLSGEAIVEDGGKGNDIDKYESDEDKEKVVCNSTANSTIKSPLSPKSQPDNEPIEEQLRPDVSSMSRFMLLNASLGAVNGADQADSDAEDSSTEPAAPPRSQAVRDARAAQKARIQAERAAQNGEPSIPKKGERPPLSQSVKGTKPARVMQKDESGGAKCVSTGTTNMPTHIMYAHPEWSESSPQNRSLHKFSMSINEDGN
jgi:hypothetical protein